MKDVIIRTLPLPSHVKAFTVTDPQGDYNVYINSALSLEQQKRSFDHEQRHIDNDDFYREESASIIEAEMP